MKFNNPYWGSRVQIEMLQRWIIIHSIIYYELDENVVSDKMFDNNAKQLVDMQAKFPEVAEKSRYWYAFEDFDGSTGFNLFDALTGQDQEWLMPIAKTVLKQTKGGSQ